MSVYQEVSALCGVEQNADESFRGWSNWATFAAGAWIGNHEGIYNFIMDLVHKCDNVNTLAWELKCFGPEEWVVICPDLTEDDAEQINWYELAMWLMA